MTDSPSKRRLVALAAMLLVASGQAGAAEPDPIPQTEQSDVLTLPPPGPHRLLVTDAVYNHAKDGRAYLVDGDSARMLGMMPAAYNANIVADPKGGHYYVAETIWTRGNRGTRQDLLSIYDAHTLALSDEISLPGRALITTKRQDADISADGHWVYVYNMTPSNSVIMVDTITKKVVASVPVPGCGLAFAWGDHGFASLCANGALASVDVADPAHPKLVRGKPFFAPEKDPVFEQSPTDRATGRTFFISYGGMVTPATLGPTPTLEAPWSINAAAKQARAPGGDTPFAVAWRPGGWQIAAYRHSDAHLFVLMHEGPYWTHKADGTEVWELDTATHALVRRIRLPAPSDMVGITQDAKPLLISSSDSGALFVLDPQSGAVLRQIRKLGDNLIFASAPGE